MKFVSALSFFVASAMAAQDTAYYGWQNPITSVDTMYYRESVNVIQDLVEGDFVSLYIRYHGCVWSEYFGEGDDDDEAGTCGADGGDQYWYMGRTQCFRANMAFSLYGVKTGQTIGTEGACARAHFINSFFTTTGVAAAQYMGLNQTYDLSSQCSYSYNGDGDDDGNGDIDGRQEPGHTEQFFANYTSVTLGCTAKGQFAMAQFSGAFCDGGHFIGSYYDNETDTDGFNAALDNLGCMMIYTEGDDMEQVENLLSSSASCSVLEYPTRCPDPHGTKAARDIVLRNYANINVQPVHWSVPVTTVLLFFISLLVLHESRQLKKRAEKRLLDDQAPEEPTLFEKVQSELNKSTSFKKTTSAFIRTASNFSSRTRSYKEKFMAYAQEEDSIISDDGDYEAPDVPGVESDVGSKRSTRSNRSSRSNKSAKSATKSVRSSKSARSGRPPLPAGAAAAAAASNAATSTSPDDKSVSSKRSTKSKSSANKSVASAKSAKSKKSDASAKSAPSKKSDASAKSAKSNKSTGSAAKSERTGLSSKIPFLASRTDELAAETTELPADDTMLVEKAGSAKEGEKQRSDSPDSFEKVEAEPEDEKETTGAETDDDDAPVLVDDEFEDEHAAEDAGNDEEGDREEDNHEEEAEPPVEKPRKTKKRRYKRPVLALVSRLLFGSSPNPATNTASDKV